MYFINLLLLILAVFPIVIYGKVQAWIPRKGWVGVKGEPYSLTCYYSGINQKRNLTVTMLKALEDGSPFATDEHSFGPPVITQTPTRGKATWTISSLRESDAGRYVCIVSQPPPDGDRTKYETDSVYFNITVRQSKDTRQKLERDFKLPKFSVQPAVNLIETSIGLSKNAACVFSGVIPNSTLSTRITRLVEMSNSTSCPTNGFTSVQLSDIIEGTGQAKWYGANASLSDTGTYMCEITMMLPNPNGNHLPPLLLKTKSAQFKLVVEDVYGDY
ncbi:protein E2 [Vespertilionid gammaherpesvirus 1]|uniref:Protein E2 n=1 Tax=Vespertilionid gammaherpesvirus 1 TaxID=2560830 RepID=A0A109QA81_9GAMA|nr:protein E2 [Myotis gammaherpesvirus 8]AMA67361.1 protein E2 [Vespertilionid gammaherpesvirus 1]